MGQILARWILIFTFGACVAIPLATIMAVAVVKPVYWLSWLIAFVLIVPPLTVAFFVNKKLVKPKN